jgi:hypothetical protein
MAISNLDDAIAAHRAWMARFLYAMKGINRERFDPNIARDESGCELGKWLLTEAKAFIPEDSHQTIALLHKTFHDIAGQIATMINRQDSEETVRKYVREFDTLSNELVHLLTLEKRRTTNRH